MVLWKRSAEHKSAVCLHEAWGCTIQPDDSVSPTWMPSCSENGKRPTVCCSSGMITSTNSMPLGIPLSKSVLMPGRPLPAQKRIIQVRRAHYCWCRPGDRPRSIPNSRHDSSYEWSHLGWRSLMLIRLQPASCPQSFAKSLAWLRQGSHQCLWNGHWSRRICHHHQPAR